MTISLFRGKKAITNFLSATTSFKETNLTAALAYLLYVYPEFLGGLFLEKREKLLDVVIEQFASSSERYDIVLVTNKRIVVIEAKLGFQQRERQIIKYIKGLIKKNRKHAVLFLLDYGSYKSSSWMREIRSKLTRRVALKFSTWGNVHRQIDRLLRSKKAKKKNEEAFAIAKILNEYMEVNNMDTEERKEVYVRDLQGDSVELFFRYKIYKSQTKFFKSAQGNLYFAPYFTGKAPKDFSERSMVKILRGISWIAPIQDIQSLNRYEIKDYLKKMNHFDPKGASAEILRESKNTKEILVLLLGDPFLAFLTPINKRKLGINGAMGSRSFTFEGLFRGVGKA